MYINLDQLAWDVADDPDAVRRVWEALDPQYRAENPSTSWAWAAQLVEEARAARALYGQD